MKTQIEELTLTSSSIEVLTPKVIADVIEEIARAKRIWGQFYKENRDLMNTGGKEIVFPKKESGITASWNLSEGSGLSASNIKYSAVTIPVKKGGLGLAFTGEAIRQAKRDVIADNLKEAGEVWADTLDVVALEAMFPSTIISSATGATQTVGGLFIGASSINGAVTISTAINTKDVGSTVSSAAGFTIKCWYAPATNAEGDTIGARVTSESSGSFSARDIFRARAEMIAKNYEPNVLVMHPDALMNILYDPNVKFLEKSVYRGEGELYNGELGQIWGLKVIVTTKCPKYGIVLIDTNHLGYHVIRKPLKMVRDDYTGMSADVLYFWGFAEENFGVVNAQAYGVVAVGGTWSPVTN